KLDLELVPNEKRLEIGKCNERLNPGKIQREPTFQVILDALALNPCYSAFLNTADVPEVDIFKICPRVQGQDFDALPTDDEIVSFLRELGHTGEINSLNDIVVDHMHQPWRTFTALINKSLSGKINGVDKLHKTLSWRNKIQMHTSTDDCLINTLRFVSEKEETQIYDAILPESLTSLEMKETQACQTYLGFATGATPHKKAQKFEKPASPKLTTVPVLTEAPTGKSKRVIRPTKKSPETPAREFDNEENEEDKDDQEEVKDGFVKTPSNDFDDKTEGDEDEEMDYTTSQLYDDVDIRLNEPVDTDKGFVQVEGTDAVMTNV
nr:hypothetical protein [Tanacetum cinerariifolium]